MRRSVLALLCLLSASGLDVSPSAVQAATTKETTLKATTAVTTEAPTPAPATKAAAPATTAPIAAAPSPSPTNAPAQAPREAPTEAPVPTETPGDEIRPPSVEAGASDSILATLNQAFRRQLRSQHFQEINGLVALIFGGVLVCNGVHFFRLAMCFAIGVTIYFTTEDDLAVRFQALSEGGEPTIWMKVIAAELAILIASICSDGEDFEGIKKLLGLFLGLTWFGSLQFDMLDSDTEWIQNAASNDVFSLIFGSSFICGGFYLMAEGPSYVIAVLAPALGGILVSSSVWYLISYISTPAPHETIYWIDFVKAIHPNNPDMGLIPGDVEGVSINRLCSVGSALLIFGISAYLQVSWAREERKKLAKKSHFWRDLKEFFLCLPVTKEKRDSTVSPNAQQDDAPAAAQS